MIKFFYKIGWVYVIAVTLLLIFGSSLALAENSDDNFFLDKTDKYLYSKLSEMEDYYYGHDYSDHFINNRLARLENTLFKYSRKRLSSKIRFQDIYNEYKSRTTPFHTIKQKQPLTDTKMSLLSFMESRVFGHEKNNIPLNHRISQLELAIFGEERKGSVEERYEFISHNTPISIKGINVSQNGKLVASVKPGYKKVPLPPSPYKENYTPLNIEYNNLAGDYFNNIARNSNGEILRWKDFPLYVMVNALNPAELTVSKAAIDNWAAKIPIYYTENYLAADILIDWASRSDYITVPLLTKSGQSKRVKVLINMYDISNKLDRSTLVTFITHQIGHAVGLWGHSEDINDIMYPIGDELSNDINIKNQTNWVYQPISLKSRSPVITDKDINTLLRIYQNPTSIDKIINNL